MAIWPALAAKRIEAGTVTARPPTLATVLVRLPAVTQFP